MPTGNQPNNPSAKTLRNRRKRLARRERMKTEMPALRDNAVLGQQVAMKYRPISTRSGMPHNPADPRTIHPLVQMGSTAAGRMAALKILHPNGECCEYDTKLPDGQATTSILLERRDEFVIPKPSTDSDSTWNCLIFDLPFLISTQAVIRWADSEAPTEPAIVAVATNIISFAGLATRQYPAFESITQDTFVFEISILRATSLSGYQNTTLGIAGDIKSLRRTYLGSTFDFDAPELANQGRVVAGQWKPDITLGNVKTTAAAPDDRLDVYQMQVPASIIPSIVQSDELTYQAEAKMGLYFPNRVAEMTVEFTAAQEWRYLNCVDPNVPASDPVDPNIGANNLWLRGWLVGTSYWSGMDRAASIRIKRKEGIEFVSAPDGPFSPFASPALPNDLRAMQVIQEFSRTEPHGFPADYNDLGTMLRNIVNGVGDAIENLGLPVISDLAKGAKGVLNSPLANKLVSVIDSIV